MISDKKKKLLLLFAEGRELYKRHDFRAALAKFKKAHTLDPEDGPTKVYCSRCKLYIETPPPKDWDGVFVMKTK